MTDSAFSAPSTWQVSSPLRRQPMESYQTPVPLVLSRIADGTLVLDPPYQRGSVWTNAQRVAWWFSLLTDVPVPSIVVNRRTWHEGRVVDVVIDGKQRLEATAAWFAGDLLLPASWFAAEDVVEFTATDDGPYVHYGQLSDMGRRGTDRLVLPFREASLASEEDEARTYLLLNGAGTPHTAADLQRASAVAGH